MISTAKTVVAKSVVSVSQNVNAHKLVRLRRKAVHARVRRTAEIRNVRVTLPTNNVFQDFVVAVSTRKTLRTRKITAETQ